MMSRPLMPIFAVVALLISGVMTSATEPVAPAPERSGVSAADTFEVDMAHSMLIFKLRHFGVSNFWGRLTMPVGTFSIDPQSPAGSSIDVTIDIKNMDAGARNRNQYLLSPDFFNVREYPTAAFKSTAIRKSDDGTLEADGNFTMHGVTHQVTATISDYTEAVTTGFGYRAGFEARFTVKRSDYGMHTFVEEGTLGDEVTIIASIEGVRQE